MITGGRIRQMNHKNSLGHDIKAEGVCLSRQIIGHGARGGIRVSVVDIFRIGIFLVRQGHDTQIQQQLQNAERRFANPDGTHFRPSRDRVNGLMNKHIYKLMN